MAAQLGGYQKGQSPIHKTDKSLLNKSLLIGKTDEGQRCVLIDGADGNPQSVPDVEFDLLNAKVR